MAPLSTILIAILLSVGLIVAVVWGLVRWWKASSDREALLFRWGLTLLDLAYLMFVAIPVVLQGGYAGAFGGIPMAAVGGLILAIIWTRPIAESVGRKFGQLYDGGDVEADPEPFYSMAEARRKQGRYPEAVAAVRTQLEKFPTDVRGQLLLAEIQADDLHDLDAARLTIERLVNQPEHAAKNIAFALTRLADWELKHSHDPEAARQCFQRILERLPDTAEAHLALQRLARLDSTEAVMREGPRAPVAVPQGDRRLGLRTDYEPWKPTPPDPTAEAAALVAQLERHPADNQAREDLAVLYARQLDRTDLAVDQLEQLITQPHAPERQIVHWLNLIAELQVQVAGDAAAARVTLQRIVDRDPRGAAGVTAQRRLATVALESRARKESQVVRLGSPRNTEEAPEA